MIRVRGHAKVMCHLMFGIRSAGCRSDSAAGPRRPDVATEMLKMILVPARHRRGVAEKQVPDR